MEYITHRHVSRAACQAGADLSFIWQMLLKLLQLCSANHLEIISKNLISVSLFLAMLRILYSCEPYQPWYCGISTARHPQFQSQPCLAFCLILRGFNSIVSRIFITVKAEFTCILKLLFCSLSPSPPLFFLLSFILESYNSVKMYLFGQAGT